MTGAGNRPRRWRPARPIPDARAYKHRGGRSRAASAAQPGENSAPLPKAGRSAPSGSAACQGHRRWRDRRPPLPRSDRSRRCPSEGLREASTCVSPRSGKISAPRKFQGHGHLPSRSPTACFSQSTLVSSDSVEPFGRSPFESLFRSFVAVVISATSIRSPGPERVDAPAERPCARSFRRRRPGQAGRERGRPPLPRPRQDGGIKPVDPPSLGT